MKNGWLPDLDALEKSDLSKVKLMWVNYPHMPTGTKGSMKLFEKLVDSPKSTEYFFVTIILTVSF